MPQPEPTPQQLAETVADVSSSDETVLSSSDTYGALKQGSSSPTLDPDWLDSVADAEIGPIDRIVARLSVERGLSTPEEVCACIEELRDWSDASVPSLASLLIERGFMTRTQLGRLEPSIEQHAAAPSIPGYEIIEKIASGSSATVFLARQVSLDRTVAIKVLSRAYWGNPRVIQRLFAEGRAAAQLNHPNIVQAIDVGQTGEACYFVMEWLEGRTVHEIIRERGRFSEAEALDIIIPIADALAHAHAKGLVHRDVKPKNIVVSMRGIPKLADLGLARDVADLRAARAEQGVALGTPYFISPEQVRGDLHIGPAADIYSLGATLYYMVTGVVPFSGRNAEEVMAKHLDEHAQPANLREESVSLGISEVIEKMMTKKPRGRFADCDELLLELRAWRACLTLQQGEQHLRGSSPLG